MELKANLRRHGLDAMAAANGSSMGTGAGLYWHPVLKRS